MRLALVTPWFGRELIGGAERLAWDLSRALVRAGQSVEVLTTCCRSFHDDWAANYHRPGVTFVDSVAIRRFRVSPRDRVAFSRANSALLALRREQLHRDRAPLPQNITEASITQGIRSRDLVHYLGTRGAAYDVILFLPYLYGTTLDGLPLVSEKAFLVPCLHDEAYAYLNDIRDVFRRARGLLFNSEGERDVAADLYGPWIHSRAQVIGHSVDVADAAGEPVPIQGFVPNRSRYILYLGRGDRTKNLEFAIEAFARFRDHRKATALQFVVAGPYTSGLRAADGVIDLGAVTEDAKAALLTYARALVQPSINESFSRTIHEAWHARRPVVVHADCRATAQAVKESGGGWIARTMDEWAEIFATIDEASDAYIDSLGQRGRAAELEVGTWDDVATRALAAIEERLGPASGPSFEQFVPLGHQRAAQHATAIDSALRSLGYASAVSIASTAPQPKARIIRHIAVGMNAEPAQAVVMHDGDGTPPSDAVVFAASRSVADALTARNISSRLLPAPVDPGRWSEAGGQAKRYDDGAVNLLSLSSLDEEQARELFHVFEIFRRRVRARLFVFDDLCVPGVRDIFDTLDPSSIIHVDSDVDARYAAFRDAHIACAFGTTAAEDLIDALWFDLPVAAYDGDPLLEEVVVQCGVLVAREDAKEFAALLFLLATDDNLRFQVIQEARRVRSRQAPQTVVTSLLEGLDIRTSVGNSAPRLT
jgi:glycosyltransferase involved in cell wall biosynthesis